MPILLKEHHPSLEVSLKHLLTVWLDCYSDKTRQAVGALDCVRIFIDNKIHYTHNLVAQQTCGLVY